MVLHNQAFKNPHDGCVEERAMLPNHSIVDEYAKWCMVVYCIGGRISACSCYWAFVLPIAPSSRTPFNAVSVFSVSSMFPAITEIRKKKYLINIKLRTKFLKEVYMFFYILHATFHSTTYRSKQMYRVKHWTATYGRQFSALLWTSGVLCNIWYPSETHLKFKYRGIPFIQYIRLNNPIILIF